MVTLIGYAIGILLFVILFTILMLYNSLSWGTVLWCFWSWFLLPVFPAIGVLTFWKAVGLMFVIDLFKNTVLPQQPKFKPMFIENDGKNKQNISIIIGPWVTLLIGFLMYLFIGWVS